MSVSARLNARLPARQETQIMRAQLRHRLLEFTATGHTTIRVQKVGGPEQDVEFTDMQQLKLTLLAAGRAAPVYAMFSEDDRTLAIADVVDRFNVAGTTVVLVTDTELQGHIPREIVGIKSVALMANGNLELALTSVFLDIMRSGNPRPYDRAAARLGMTSDELLDHLVFGQLVSDLAFGRMLEKSVMIKPSVQDIKPIAPLVFSPAPKLQFLTLMDKVPREIKGQLLRALGITEPDQIMDLTDGHIRQKMRLFCDEFTHREELPPIGTLIPQADVELLKANVF